MVEEIINSIIEAEKRAEEIKKEGAVRARESVDRAEADADALKKSALAKYRSELKEAERAAAQTADEKASAMIEEGEKEALSLKLAAESRLGAAVDFIVKGILAQ